MFSHLDILKKVIYQMTKHTMIIYIYIIFIWVCLNMVFTINKKKPFEKRDFGMPNFQVEAQKKSHWMIIETDDKSFFFF